jgi:hypothetical protein
MAYNDSIDWKNVIRKEVRGFDDADPGEIQEALRDNIITKSGVGNKEVCAIGIMT